MRRDLPDAHCGVSGFAEPDAVAAAAGYSRSRSGLRADFRHRPVFRLDRSGRSGRAGHYAGRVNQVAFPSRHRDQHRVSCPVAAVFLNFWKKGFRRGLCPFAGFIGVRQFPLDRLVTDVSGRVLGCAQKRLFADSGTHMGGCSDSAIGDLVGEAFADFTGDATTGGKASGGRDGACAKLSILFVQMTGLRFCSGCHQPLAGSGWCGGRKT